MRNIFIIYDLQIVKLHVILKINAQNEYMLKLGLT